MTLVLYLSAAANTNAQSWALLFMLPLIFLQLVSVRNIIGLFQLHYGIPFVIVALLILIMVLFDSARVQSKMVWIAIFALLAVNHAQTDAWIKWATQVPVFSIQASQRYIEELTPDENHSVCGSVGVPALAPDRFAREQFVKGEISDHCTSVILFEGGLDYRRCIRSCPRLSSPGLTNATGLRFTGDNDSSRHEEAIKIRFDNLPFRNRNEGVVTARGKPDADTTIVAGAY
ncbi:MAG: hypothetical protein H5U12_20510 [Hoeflea sp.]|nr:hypothetical protein [Hoeflea sp.]